MAGLAAVVLHMAAQAAFADLSALSELHVRATPVATWDIYTSPRGSLTLLGPRDQLTMEYSPRIFLRENTSAQVLHVGSLSAAHRATSRWITTLTLGGAYGTRDLVTPPWVPGGGGRGARAALPGNVTRLTYMAADATLNLAGPVGQRSSARFSLEAATDGAVSAADQVLLPRKKGASATAALELAAGHDKLDTAVSGSVTDVGPGNSRATIVSLSETWHHPLGMPTAPADQPAASPFRPPDAGAQLWLGVGASATRGGEAVGERGGTRILPTGEAGVRGKARPLSLEGSLALHVEPVLDRISGLVYTRGDATAGVHLKPAPSWALTGSVSGSLIADGPQAGQRAVAVGTNVTWPDRGFWQLNLGVRLFSQNGRPPYSENFTETTVFLSLFLHDRIRL
jgi:hypothetical protein